jgi:hypothetical protein
MIVRNAASLIRPFAGGVALCLILLGVFWPAIIGHQLIAPLDVAHKLIVPWKADADGSRPQNHYACDAVTQYLIYRDQAERSFREDGYIGWNPYEMGGVSLSANTMALPASWTMQLHRVLSFAKAWNYGIIAEFLIAGLGMLVFLRSRKLAWLICVFGAVAYMLNSQFIFWIHHRWALSSFSWMPWALWAGTAMETGARHSSRKWLLPVFLCLALLGATLQHVVFILMASGCMTLGYCLPLRSADWKKAALWIGGFAIALLLCAFTLLPQTLAYLGNISLGNTRGGIGYPEGHSQALLNFIAIPFQGWPWLFGDAYSMDGWRALKSSYMNLAYMGTIPMLLAFVGLFRKEMPPQARLMAALGLLIPLTPLVGPLYHRVQLVFLLGGSWLAAEMLQLLVRGDFPNLRKRWLLVVAWIGECLLVATLLSDDLKSRFKDFVMTMGAQGSKNSLLIDNPDWLHERCSIWIQRLSLMEGRTFCLYFLLILGAVALWLVASRVRKFSTCGQYLLIAVVTLELAVFARTWITFSPQDQFPVTHPVIGKLQQLVGMSRVYQGKEQLGFLDTFATPNMLTSNGIRCVEGYESILHDGPFVVYRDAPPELRLRLSGAAWSVQQESLPVLHGTEQWPVVSMESGVVIRKNPHALPSALAGTEAIPSARLDVPALLDHATEIQLTHRTMNTISLNVPSGVEWVRLDENADPGWRWRSEGGGWQPVFKGPDACAWLLLKGAHGHVELRYEPSNQIGMALSGCGIMAMLLFVASPPLMRAFGKRKVRNGVVCA